MLPTVDENRGYDFLDPENAEKWRGLLVNPLKKVLENVHPELTAEESALEYVESLCLQLLGTLCAQPVPLTVQDVEERINRVHRGAVARCALAKAAEEAHGKKWRGVLPQERLQTLLKEVLLYKLDASVSIYMTAILEHVSGEVLKLAGNYIKKIPQRAAGNSMSCRDVKTAMCADKVLMGMFSGDREGGVAAPPAGPPGPPRRGALGYSELVRDLLADEKQALRDLHLVIRVFKDELERILDKDPRTIALIFGNIVDIYELTVTLLGNLEDAIEMSEDSPTPYIGSCFEELAEVEEFRAYVRYANIVTRADSRQALQQLVDDPALSERLETAGRGFRLAVKYQLPRLLLAPVGRVFLYHSYVLAFLKVAPASDDRESFKQVECNLHPIKKLLVKALANGPKLETQLPVSTRVRRQLAIEKCQELAKTVENWDGRDVAQCCTEFVREDTLVKLGPGRRAAERRAFLFDGLLLLCKPVPGATTGNSTASTLLGGGSGSGGVQLKLKEKLHVRKLEILEHVDTDAAEARHCLELSSGGASLALGCSSAADRRAWLADLVMLSTRPMLDRALDSILADLEKRHPLQLPPASLYRFAVPDAPDNIVLEEHKGATPAPLIKGATLLKLVERLTYHIYADLNLVRTFLTTYRSFCSPQDLLRLLIERFRIPEPGAVYDPPQPDSIESIASDAEKLSKNSTREDWKRYRKEFEQPVKFRVINVLRHWVDQHFYDFERDPPLLQQLKEFLESVDGKPMKKWVQSVLKTLQRKSVACDVDLGVCHVFDKPAPPVLRHLHDPDRCDWHPLALHPVELARQLTVLEFRLYRQVKPSELVGAVWTKKDKEKTSPNLLRIIKHTTNFTRWMEKWIVCSENLEERVGVVCRLLALASALHALHNFNAVLACVCAAGSASVHRLARTWQLVPPRLLRVLQALRELNADHFRRYQERLRSINPPCVPFLGMYLTNILHIEEGNLDYLPNSELINFSKRRKVAEITGEIQQYQNQPYCLTVEPKTRAFLENLDPFPGMDDNEITNYLYGQSLHIEPRAPTKPPPKFPRRYPELSLKLVKVSSRSADQQPADDNISVSQLSPTGSSMWGDGASVCSLPIHDDRGSRSEERGSLISPRLERSASHTFSQLSLLDKGLALFDKSTRSTTRSSSGKDEPPSPRERHSPRHSRQPSAERRPVALSPRGAIVDAELFYCSQEHLHPPRTEERVPPLLPRNSITQHGADEPPRVPPRPNDDAPPTLPPAPGSEPPASPPERPPPSPKHQELVNAARLPALSPKRSPAPQPPPSPHVSAERALAFSFPSRGAPTPSPPAPPLTPHPTSSASSACGTPPPLPPRRRRDSCAPPTPAPAAPPPAPPAPPPLPPRPPPPPELLRPAHSTILQRRQHSNTAPQLPPKPPPPAVAPRT